MNYTKFITDKILNQFNNSKTRIYPLMGNH